MARTVAYIGKITKIEPIKGADFIVSAEVVCGEGGKWLGTVPKDQFECGELVQVFLQDAIVPETEEFEFMRQYKFRVSMRRFKKVPSECLIWKLNLESTDEREAGKPCCGDIITGIEKYEKPVPPQLRGTVKGNFPIHILPKTDEPNFQSSGRLVRTLQGKQFYSTVKADGTSGTVYHANGHFGVCSRNLELKPDENNAYWAMVAKYDMINKIPDGIGIQFEIIGPGIQKNPMGLKEMEIRVFQVRDIENRTYFNAEDFLEFCKTNNLPHAEIVDWDIPFEFTDDEALRKYAEGKYTGTKTQREGVVIRPMVEEMVRGERLSFKVINLKYKGD